MPMYRVRWEIDLKDDTPREAAEHALRIQRNNDPENIATVFDVLHTSLPDGEVRIDLTDVEAEDDHAA